MLYGVTHGYCAKCRGRLPYECVCDDEEPHFEDMELVGIDEDARED